LKGSVLSVMLKGVCVGSTMMVPGVSGGSMAMLLGIYDRLIYSVNSIRSGKSLLLLGTFSIGGFIGILLFSQPLLSLLERYPMLMLYFFMGAVGGGIPLMLKKAEVRRFSMPVLIWPAVGMLLVWILSLLPEAPVQAGLEMGLKETVFLIITGIAAAVALVLPGISVSYLLLVFGIYDGMILALHGFHLPVLAPFGIGLLLGIFLSTKTLEHAMKHYPRPTYLMIFGFILASLAEIFPGVPEANQMLLCCVLAGAGFFAVRSLSGLEDTA
jgi:putative membrane protein